MTTTRTDRLFAFLDNAVIVVGIAAMLVSFVAFVAFGIAVNGEVAERAAETENTAQCVD
jgi:cell division protein FtsX